MTNATDRLLEVEDLKVAFGAIVGLDGVSIHVAEREIVALIGANGAGKTTLLRAISRLVAAAQGRISFAGRDLSGCQAHEVVALGIAHAPEGRLVFPELSVKENLALGAYLRRDDRTQDLEQVFVLFPRLKERIDQAAGTLSGGEQQMLAIGRALMSRPRLLLLDEPSLGLAPKLVRGIFDTIREINARGTTVLLVEQNAHMALAVANRAYVLETGNIVLSGPAAELANDESVRRAYLGE